MTLRFPSHRELREMGLGLNDSAVRTVVESFHALPMDKQDAIRAADPVTTAAVLGEGIDMDSASDEQYSLVVEFVRRTVNAYSEE